MEVDEKQYFKCWGCPSSEASPVKTVFHSSNGYYGYLPRNVSSESTNSVRDAEKTIRCILAGRKRTYNEMCSGVNYVALDSFSRGNTFVLRVREIEDTLNVNFDEPLQPGTCLCWCYSDRSDAPKTVPTQPLPS